MGVTAQQALTPRPAQSTAKRFARWRHRNRHAVEGWLILTPILLYYSLFFLFPVLSNLYISFTRWNGIQGAPVWVGLANYKMYLTQAYPLIVFNTLLFAVIILFVQTTLAFFIAVLLNQEVIGRGLYRALWYIPTLTAAAVTAQVAFAFISPFDGVAALQGIHRELYEAAMVDGATGRDLLRHITLPLLRPMIIFVLVTGMIGGFQIFEAVLLMSKGGPSNQTNVMLLQIYNDAFVNTNMGLAAAGAVIMAVMLLWFSITNMRLMSRGQVEM